MLIDYLKHAYHIAGETYYVMYVLEVLKLFLRLNIFKKYIIRLIPKIYNFVS